MKHMFLIVATLAALFANTATAQGNCPRTKAQTVPRDVQFYGVVKCGSVSLDIGGATFSGPNQGCPLLAVLVPQHEREVDQTNGANTQTRVYTQVSTRIYHFACDRDWLLFIPWDSTCRLVQEKAGSALPRMTTVPCPSPVVAAPIAP